MPKDIELLLFFSFLIFNGAGLLQLEAAATTIRCCCCCVYESDGVIAEEC